MINILITEFIDQEALKILSKDFNVIIKLHAFSWEQKKYHYQSTLFLNLSQGNNNITLLKCTSSYPAPIEEANLSLIKEPDFFWGAPFCILTLTNTTLQA